MRLNGNILTGITKIISQTLMKHISGINGINVIFSERHRVRTI
jgi:hypothetical protein